MKSVWIIDKKNTVKKVFGEVINDYHFKDMDDVWHQKYYWYSSFDDAVKRAKSIRKKKISELQSEIDRLNNIEYNYPDNENH